jgi:hypothetical protein
VINAHVKFTKRIALFAFRTPFPRRCDAAVKKHSPSVRVLSCKAQQQERILGNTCLNSPPSFHESVFQPLHCFFVKLTTWYAYSCIKSSGICSVFVNMEATKLPLVSVPNAGFVEYCL